MPPINVSFLPLKGSFPSGLFCAKLCCRHLLQQGGWMSQECIEEQRAGQCGGVGSDLQQVTAAQLYHCWRAVVVRTPNHGDKHRQESFPLGWEGWSVILSLSLLHSFMEIPSPAPSFSQQDRREGCYGEPHSGGPTGWDQQGFDYCSIVLCQQVIYWKPRCFPPLLIPGERLAHLLMLVVAHGLGQNWVFFAACAVEKHL